MIGGVKVRYREITASGFCYVPMRVFDALEANLAIGVFSQCCRYGFGVGIFTVIRIGHIVIHTVERDSFHSALLIIFVSDIIKFSVFMTAVK